MAVKPKKEKRKEKKVRESELDRDEVKGNGKKVNEETKSNGIEWRKRERKES